MLSKVWRRCTRVPSSAVLSGKYWKGPPSFRSTEQAASSNNLHTADAKPAVGGNDQTMHLLCPPLSSTFQPQIEIGSNSEAEPEAARSTRELSGGELRIAFGSLSACQPCNVRHADRSRSFPVCRLERALKWPCVTTVPQTSRITAEMHRLV